LIISYYVLIGDGESAEGSVWEACNLAAHYKLDNLTLIIDVNRLGQSEETSLQHDVEVYNKRFQAFGFHTIKVDGHDLLDVVDAFERVWSHCQRSAVM
jgi:transketolase